MMTVEAVKTREDYKLRKLENSLIELRDLFRKHQRYIKDHFKISEQEMEILQFVALNGKKKMKELGEAFNIKLSTLTSIIDKVEKQKLVRRVNSKDDRRAVFLELTPKGEKVYERYSHYIHVMAMLMRRAIADENYEVFVNELEHIMHSISEL